MRYPGATVSAVLAATPEQIWPIVSDVLRHAQIAGSGEVQAVRMRDNVAPGAGAIFESQQKMRGIRYTTANRIVDWQPQQRIAWRIGFSFAPGIAQAWHFRLTPVEGGTRVENAVALIYAMPTGGPFRSLREALGSGYAGSVVPTIERLAQILDIGAPKDWQIAPEPPEDLSALLPSAGLIGGLLLGGAGVSLLVFGLLLRALFSAVLR